MQDTGYIGFYPVSRIPNPASIGAEMAQTMINAPFVIMRGVVRILLYPSSFLITHSMPGLKSGKTVA
jgi:hypothetical protein